MQDLNDKLTGGNLSANEWNEIPSEIQNVIVAAGITLSGGDLSQLLKAVQLLGGRGNYYDRSGSVNAVILTSPSGVQPFTAYFTGMEIVYVTPVASNNSGAATINVDGLGVKPVIIVPLQTARPLVANELRGITRLIYDGTDFVVAEPYAPLQNNIFVQGVKADFTSRVPLIGINGSDVIEVGGVLINLNMRAVSILNLFTGSDLAFTAAVNSFAALYYDGVQSLKTQNNNSGTLTTGATVLDGLGAFRDCGMNVMPIADFSATNVNLIERAKVGFYFEYTGAGAATAGLASDANIPVGATWVISNNSSNQGDVTIDAEGNTLRWFNGDGNAPATGNRTLGSSGVATILKHSTTEYRIWGSGLS